MHSRSGNSRRRRAAGPVALTPALVSLLVTIVLFAGCSRELIPERIDSGMAEQVFTPRISKQESGEYYCQWTEFLRDSIGGAGRNWDAKSHKLGDLQTYDYINRRYVQCIPELQRFQFADQSTATIVAHSCIQESFFVVRDSTGKRKAAWLTAPAVLTYPVTVDSLFMIFYESSTQKGLISVWVDRGGRELSRDTLDLQSPDFAAANSEGVTFVKAGEDAFQVYQMNRLCCWVEKTEVKRGQPASQQVGTDYFVSGGDLFIVSGYHKPESRELEIETHVLHGTHRMSQHIASVKRESMGEYVAFRAIPSGKEFPYLLALSQEQETMKLGVLEIDDEGYWSRASSTADVRNSIQEFSGALDGQDLLAVFTGASSDSVAGANAVYFLQFELE